MQFIESIEEVHAIELGILDYFVSLCKRKGLRYFVAQGTLLGAARHKGFIPWDDDIDICMPRPDYDSFLELTCCIDPPYRLVHFEADNRFRRSFTKLIDERTDTEEPGDNKNFSGIWIDIFCVDGLGNDKKTAHVLHRRNVRSCKRILFCREGLPGRSFFEKVCDAACSAAICAVNEKWLYRQLRSVLLRTPYDESRYVGRNVDNFGELEVYERSLIGEMTTVLFEGRKLCAPAMFEEYLKHYYGDYHQLPPTEKRRPKHITNAKWKD